MTKLDSHSTHWHRAVAAIESQDFAGAEAILADSLRRLPERHLSRVPFLAQRAHTLCPLGRMAEAVADVHEALALLKAAGMPGDAATLHRLGLTLVAARREAEALPVLRGATDQAPGAGIYWKTRGDAEQALGLLDDAERSFERTVTEDTVNWAAQLSLARLRRWTAANNHIARLEAAPARSPLHMACKGYALFKEYDDIGKTDAAWAWLQKGAKAARSRPQALGRPVWSASAERETVAAWREHFPREAFAAAATDVRHSGPRRIFITGLPRSGTTLIERILAAHSKVQALGELPTFPAATKTASGSPTALLLDADTIAAAARTEARTIAAAYEAETSSLNNGLPFATDKLPDNYQYAGLIRRAFPDAILLHVHRDPMDSLFGAYKLNFAAPWSFDQDDLAAHYANYRAAMQHWKACLGDTLIDISLEALIDDPKTQIHRLLNACGLPFEPACLSPHAAEGTVASASAVQVRKAINAEGVGAWRRYATQLEPLRRRLEEMGFVDRNGTAIS